VQSRRAPALGEHNEEVLKELGFSASEISTLLSNSVVGRAKERRA